MFCKSCGAPLNQGESFCPNCGAPVLAGGQPACTNPNLGYGTAQTQIDPNWPKAGDAVPAMVFGIVSLCFALSIYFSLLGVIFGAVALAKVNRYLDRGGAVNGFSKTGRGLGLAGLIVGIVGSVFWTLIFLLAMCAA